MSKNMQRVAKLETGLTPKQAILLWFQETHGFNPTFPIWLNIPLSKSSAFFKPLSICETLAVDMAIITP